MLRKTLWRSGVSSQWIFSVHSSCSLATEVHVLKILCSLWHHEKKNPYGTFHRIDRFTRKSSPFLAQTKDGWAEEGVLETVTHRGSAWVWSPKVGCMGQSGNVLCNQRGSQCCLPAGSRYVSNAVLYLRKSASNSRVYRNRDANFIMNSKDFLQKTTHRGSLPGATQGTHLNIQGQPTVCWVLLTG